MSRLYRTFLLFNKSGNLENDSHGGNKLKTSIISTFSLKIQFRVAIFFDKNVQVRVAIFLGIF